MPTNRRFRKTTVREKLSKAQWDYLIDAVDLDESDKKEAYFWDLFMLDSPHDGHGSSRRLWEQYRQDVLDIWIPEFPGTRPRCWWMHEAPRIPVGRWPGCFFDGRLPEPRIHLSGPGSTAWDDGLAVVPCFQLGLPESWDEIDPDDPPIFESQPQYLRRHGLLTPLELRKLQPSDFEPEPIFDLPISYQSMIYRRSQKEQLNNQLQNELDSRNEKGKIDDGIAEEIQERT